MFNVRPTMESATRSETDNFVPPANDEFQIDDWIPQGGQVGRRKEFLVVRGWTSFSKFAAWPSR